LRGDGAQLLNNLGERFMSRYDKLLELAPRDIVARAIVEESINTDKDHVWLDITTKTTEKSKEWLFARFPQISSVCKTAGIDISKDLIPVSPAAHYLMGGLVTNTYGETSVPGLFAIGETACTGVHGANRLASNSLLETVIFSHRAIDQIISPKTTEIGTDPVQTPYSIPFISSNQAETILTASEIKKEIQNIMWAHAGVIRRRDGLEFTRLKLEQLARNGSNTVEISDYETQSLLTVSRLMIDAALRRTESRGSHFREDFATSDDKWKTHIHYQIA
jgi:L-aspartate oxidase